MLYTEAVAQMCFGKSVFLEILQNSLVFSSEFPEISKNTFSCRTLPVDVLYITDLNSIPGEHNLTSTSLQRNW